MTISGYKLVCFVEEPSAKEMLMCILPRVGIIDFHVVVFEGKQDLDRRLQPRLRAWREPHCIFLILRDKDSADCCKLKQKILDLCLPTEKNVIVRIACHELETFYLGDLGAVEKGLGIRGLSSQQNRRIYRDPDSLTNPSKILDRLTQGKYQKILGSRSIGRHLNLESNNSKSFNVLMRTIRKFLDLQLD